MDKYELNIKLEQLRKLIKRKEYNTAAKIADTIEWNRIKNNQDLLMAADIYEASGKLVNAREVLLYAYERTNLGRQIVYRLCRVATKLGDIVEAEEFFAEFVKMAVGDNSKFILQYEIARAKGAPLDTQIAILSKYLDEEMDDKWAYELAKLYHKANRGQECAKMCDTIILWFSDGKYVEKALELKSLYAPLTKEQQSRVFKESIIPVIDRTEEVEDANMVLNEMQGIKAEEIQVKDYSNKVGYDTVNIQRELAESMKDIFGDDAWESNETDELEVSEESNDVEESEIPQEVESPEDLAKTKEVNLETTKVFTPISKQMLGEVEEPEESVEEVIEETVEEAVEEAVEDDGEQMEIALEQPGDMEEIVPEIAEDVETESLEEVDEDHIEGQLTIDEVLAMFNLDVEEEEPIEEEPAQEEPIEEQHVEETVEEEPAQEESTEEEAVEELVEEESVEEEIIEEPVEEEMVENAIEDTMEESVNSEEEVVEDGEKMEDSDKEFVKRNLIPEAKQELKDFISRFTGVKGIDKQILKAMHSVLKTSADESNFIFIIGDVKSGKTTLAIDIIKVLNKIMENRGRKIAKVPGSSLSGKDMDKFMYKVAQSDIVVEKVSSMGEDSLEELIKAVRNDNDSKIVIFEDEVITSEKFVRDICEKLNVGDNIIVLKQSRIKEWAEIALEYIKEEGYEIDEMGILAMHERIDKLHALTLVIQKNHVEQVIDRAITKHNKRKITNLFKGSKSNVLTEKDFIED